EHGWSDEGVFNFEGGCYAKAINLTEDSEPDIYRTTQMFGTVLENVVLDPNSLKPDFTDTSLTENTRVSYPAVHPQSRARRTRRSSQERRPAHGRRVRRVAAHRPPNARPGALLFPVGLHGQGRRHRA